MPASSSMAVAALSCRRWPLRRSSTTTARFLRTVQSVCAKMEISLQPARPHTPTDKSPLERWFRTLSQALLVALPGYKGSDVHSRGLEAEDGAFYFLGELEAIIREWVQLYHCVPRQGRRALGPEIPAWTWSPGHSCWNTGIALREPSGPGPPGSGL